MTIQNLIRILKDVSRNTESIMREMEDTKETQIERMEVEIQYLEKTKSEWKLVFHEYENIILGCWVIKEPTFI